MDIKNKEIEISEPRMVKSHDVILDAEYAEWIAEDLGCRAVPLDDVLKEGIDLHDYVFRYGLKHGSISSYDRLTELCTDDVTAIIQGFSDNCTDRSVATIIPILRSILKYLYDECIVRNDYSGMVMSAVTIAWGRSPEPLALISFRCFMNASNSSQLLIT